MTRTRPRVMLTFAGLICVLFSAVLAARLVWEQTALTIREGPQMVGFSLMHTVPPLILAPFAAALWALIVLAKSLHSRSWPGRFRLGLLGLYAAAVVFMSVPYGYWQRLNVRTLAHGAHVGDFVCSAAATGDLATVKSFLAEGVPVDVRAEDDGSTPLDVAARAGETAVMEYFLARGANVNALNEYGDSPLQDAMTSGKSGAIALLKAHGGKAIVGSDAQRSRAIREQVDRSLKGTG